MGKIDPDVLKKQLEESVDGFRHNRYELLLKISQEYRKQGMNKESDYANYESGAFALIVNISNKVFPGYFQPMMTYSDGSAIPPIEFFIKDCLDYLGSQAFSTKNPILSARFSDVVWDFRKNNVKLAQNAIDQYLKCAEIYKKNLWGIEYSTSIARAIQLASMINDLKFIAKVKDFSMNELSLLAKNEDFRFCIDIGEAIAQSKINLDEKEQGSILDVFKKGTEYYGLEHDLDTKKLGPSKGPNDHLANSLNSTLILLNSKKKIKIDVNDTKKKIAESYQKHGDEFFEKGNYLGSVMYYVKSEKLFREVGVKEKVNELRLKIQNAGIKNYENLNEISVNQTIDKEKFDQYLKPLIGKDVRESLRLLSSAPHFIPIFKSIENFTEELKEKFPLQIIIPKVLVEERGAVRVSSQNEEIKNISIIQNLILDINISNIFLHELFQRMKDTQGLTPLQLTLHFHDWSLCNADNIEILNRGFQFYFKGDYVSAVHLLIFQFEDLLRNLLKDVGFPVITPDKFVTLQPLIRNEQLSSVGGADLIKYYEILLIEPDGINLRNNVAHGLLSLREMNEYTVERIIHVLLTLTRFKIEIQKQG